MKIHTDIEQGSLAWLELRAGKVTASEIDALVSPLGKVREGAGVQTYLNQKLAERWIGAPLPSVQGVFDLEQGQILEERAKPAFTIHTGIETRNVAFIEADGGRFGCSPDAMAESSGVEIKCARIETHIGYLMANKLPAQYVGQVQFSMWVTGFQNWHFFSYHRKLPPLHLLIGRDEAYQDAISDALKSFLARFDEGWTRLVEINGGEPVRV